ncbi:MAG: ion transporter [Candidatus Omnitrophota bacterium]
MKNTKSRPIEPHAAPWRAELFEIIFGAETPAGKAFDVALLWAIFISVFVVLLESVKGIRLRHGPLLHAVEWSFTFVFTVEYVLRLVCVKRPRRYALSFFGIVDFLAVIPTYLGLFFTSAQSLLVIRALRLLRVFRVLKLGRYLGELDVLIKASKASKDKILVFLMVIMTITVIMGTVMYLVEGEANGFTSIPRSIYWAIVTITTVGYGDIAPQTVFGQVMASLIMIMGYAIIVVPTGIFSVELSLAARSMNLSRKCPRCELSGHEDDSLYCRFCGGKLKT